MQMNALRSANFLKLSSSNSTSDEYWVASISAGTPAGYCLSQIRSMVIFSRLPVRRLSGPDDVFWDSIEPAAAQGKHMARQHMASGGGLTGIWLKCFLCHSGATRQRRTPNLRIPRCTIVHLKSGANAPSRNDVLK